MKREAGSITPHRDRYGRVRFHVRLTIDGVRQSLGLHDTEAEAEDVLAGALEQVTQEQRGGLTLRTWGDRWLERRATDGLHRAAHKDDSAWRSRVATAPFAGWPMRRIARTDIVAWVKLLLRTPATSAITRGRGAARCVETRELGRNLSRQSVVLALALLRRALGDAADEGLVPGNVAVGVRVPRVARTDEPWTYLEREEIDAVLGLALRPDQRAIFTVSIYTGLRGGELWGLRWSDVVLDGKRPQLVVRHSYRGATKGGKVRRVPLLAPAREVLRAWRRGIGAALVFPADGQGCHAEGFDAGLRRVLRLAGITRRVRFHDLRHTCASHLLMGTLAPGLAPMRLEDVRLWMGHSTVGVTERYAHLAPERLHAIAAESIALPTDREERTK